MKHLIPSMQIALILLTHGKELAGVHAQRSCHLGSEILTLNNFQAHGMRNIEIGLFGINRKRLNALPKHLLMTPPNGSINLI